MTANFVGQCSALKATEFKKYFSYRDTFCLSREDFSFNNLWKSLDIFYIPRTARLNLAINNLPWRSRKSWCISDAVYQTHIFHGFVNSTKCNHGSKSPTGRHEANVWTLKWIFILEIFFFQVKKHNAKLRTKQTKTKVV